MTVQEIITELEKMSVEERREITKAIQQFPPPLPEKPKRKLSEVLREFAGTVDDWPADMSVNHDHYLYGTPRRPS